MSRVEGLAKVLGLRLAVKSLDHGFKAQKTQVKGLGFRVRSRVQSSENPTTSVFFSLRPRKTEATCLQKLGYAESRQSLIRQPFCRIRG